MGTTAPRLGKGCHPVYRAGIPLLPGRLSGLVLVRIKGCLGLVDDDIRGAESELSPGVSKFQASALGLCTKIGGCSHASPRFDEAGTLLCKDVLETRLVPD